MEILKVRMVNDSPRVYCLGSTDLIPGTEAVEVDASYQEHPEIKEAIKAGHLRLVEDAPAVKTVDEMTAAELKQYADDNGIDLGEAKTKPEILAAIKAAQV